MREMNLGWAGMLTIENVEKVAELFRELLQGKRYTFVSANEFFGFKPEVRTRQRLAFQKSDPIQAFKEKDGKSAGIMVHAPFGVWSIHTNLAKNQHDPEFKNPYLAFDWNRVTITHRAPGGNKLYWVVALERKTDD